MWKRGELKATQLPTGTVIVDVQKTEEETEKQSVLLSAWGQNAIS